MTVIDAFMGKLPQKPSWEREKGFCSHPLFMLFDKGPKIYLL